jgi:hypothetical protein
MHAIFPRALGPIVRVAIVPMHDLRFIELTVEAELKLAIDHAVVVVKCNNSIVVKRRCYPLTVNRVLSASVEPNRLWHNSPHALVRNHLRCMLSIQLEIGIATRILREKQNLLGSESIHGF